MRYVSLTMPGGIAAARKRKGSAGAKGSVANLIPRDVDDAEVEIEGKKVKLTNLRKLFWPELEISKGDLLRYYAEVSPALLPHLLLNAALKSR